MIQNVDLNDNRNLFTVSVVLIAGVGGLVLKIGPVTITAVACALILGILTNLIVNIKSRNNDGNEQLVIEEVAPATEEVTAPVQDTVAENKAEEK